jgi:hypothetical protein
MRRILVLLLSLVLSGCYTPNHARLSAHIGQRVTVGTPLSVATASLTQAGFDCDATSQAPAMDCSRIRTGFLYSCVERVLLKTDASTGRVSAVDVQKIACAGL